MRQNGDWHDAELGGDMLQKRADDGLSGETEIVEHL